MKHRKLLLLKRVKMQLVKITPLVTLFIKIKYSFKKDRERNLVKKKLPSKSIVYENNENAKPKDIVIFATHCVDNIIPNSTIYYLSELNKIFDYIIFISDNVIDEIEITKIKKLVNYALFENHNEYDFGSYKRGIQHIYNKGFNKLLPNLLICNDSVYGPIFDLNKIINQMNSKPCDFWGLVEGFDIRRHLQSWFIYFKQNIFSTNDLYNFLINVKEQEIVWDIIIKYETKLTSYLKHKRFIYKSYLPLYIKDLKKDELLASSPNKTLFPLYCMQHYKFPFVKKKYFNGAYDKFNVNKKDALSYIKEKNNEVYNLIIDENKLF